MVRVVLKFQLKDGLTEAGLNLEFLRRALFLRCEKKHRRQGCWKCQREWSEWSF